MANGNLDRLRDSRRSPHVALHQFNSVRSRHPKCLVCVFEGIEDVTFFDTVFFRILGAFEYLPLSVNGKDQVLGLRALIERSYVHDSKLVRFFVDRDFDGTKGHPTGSNLYVTPTYSIENLLINEGVLHGLLRGEYRCSNEHGDLDVEAVLPHFRKFAGDICGALADANLLIYYARTQQRPIRSIEENIGKYVDIRIDGAQRRADRVALLLLVIFDEPADWAEVEKLAAAFGKLNPMADWRGKFWLSCFKKYLSLLKEDRCSEKPSVFRERFKVRFDPNAELIRTLAMLCELPKCLSDFVQAMNTAGTQGN